VPAAVSVKRLSCAPDRHLLVLCHNDCKASTEKPVTSSSDNACSGHAKTRRTLRLMAFQFLARRELFRRDSFQA
jgi:hypothetical protein